MFGKPFFTTPVALVALLLLAALLLSATTVHAATIDVVPVGNPGNPGELAGKGAGGYGPNRTCGAVDYAYKIGTYEVTAGQYTEFLNAVGGVDTYGLYNTSMWSGIYGCKIERYAGSGTVADPYRYRVDIDYEYRPVNYVSWGDAARFCNWLHNGQPGGAQDNSTTEDGAYFLNGATSDSALMAITRQSDATWFIPTENEWYKAAYHKNDGATGNYFDYPTSSDNTSAPFLSNDVIDPDPGNNANFYQNGHTVPHTTNNSYWTTEVGEFENSDSPYGTFDQGGNLWEWNESVVNSGGSYGVRGVRGGGWQDDSGYLQASYRSYHWPTAENGHIGFRVASVPEPGSITLLVFGAVAGLLWWRRRN